MDYFIQIIVCIARSKLHIGIQTVYYSIYMYIVYIVYITYTYLYT